MTRAPLVYPFLDPTESGGLPLYIIGLGIGCCIVFSIVKGICLLRRRLSLRYNRFEDSSGAESAVPKEAPASDAHARIANPSV